MTVRRCVANAAVALLVAGAACSEPRQAAHPPGERSRLGKRSGAAGKPPSGDKHRKEPGRDGTGQPATPDPPEAAATGANDEAGDDGASTPSEDGAGDDSSSRFARGRSDAREPTPDAEKSGVTPTYSEITAASVVGLGRTFRVTIEFLSDVPKRMPNSDTHMFVNFTVHQTDDEQSYSLGARATETGWEPYAGSKGKDDRYPGRFEVTGRTVAMTIPWSYLGGARRMDWYAGASWLSSVAGTTNYSFDTIPNDARGHYPE